MTQLEFEASIAKIQRGDKEGLREIYEAYISYILALTAAAFVSCQQQQQQQVKPEVTVPAPQVEVVKGK